MTNEKIILRPKYVADFQCDGSKCNSKCCRNNWRIDIDVDTYKKYQRIKNPVMRKKILSSIQPSTSQIGFEIKFNKDGVCPLLCDDNLCYIHRNFGEEALSITGRVYPRYVIHIGEYQFRTLSMTCPLAVEAALFSRNGMELQQVVGGEDTGAWQLAAKYGEQKDIDNDLMAVHIIMGGLSILQNASYSFEQRLVLLGLFSDRVEDCQQDVEVVAGLIDYYNSDEFHQEISGLLDNWQYYPAAHKQLLEGIFKTLEQEGQLAFIKPWLIINENYDELYEKNYLAAKEQLEAVLERFWQNEWLSHGFPFALQGHLLHNYFAYLVSYEICKLYIFSTYESDKTWDKNFIINMLGEFSKMFDHRKDFLATLVKETEIFEKEPLKLMQVLLRL